MPLTDEQRNAMGTTPDGRLHGAPATWALLDAMAEVDHPNAWDRAQVVADAADSEVANAALWHLLGLRWHDLETDEPQVAVRNVRAGDFVRLHGGKYYVREVLDRAPSRSPWRAITLKVEVHGPGGRPATFAYDAHVQIPLIARSGLMDDAESIGILAAALRTSYTWTLDALAACLLEGGRPRREPSEKGAKATRRAATRIEGMLRHLGRPVDRRRREDIERKARG